MCGSIYVNAETPNLGFPYFNFLGGYQWKTPCIWCFSLKTWGALSEHDGAAAVAVRLGKAYYDYEVFSDMWELLIPAFLFVFTPSQNSQSWWIQSNLMVFLYVPPQVYGLVIVAMSNERENWCLHNHLNPDTRASLHMCAQLINLIAKWLISVFAPKWLISVFAPPLKLSRNVELLLCEASRG